MAGLLFTIEESSSRRRLCLCLKTAHGVSVELDGEGSIHGQTARAISSLLYGFTAAAVDDFLDDPEAEQDYVRWESEGL